MDLLGGDVCQDVTCGVDCVACVEAQCFVVQVCVLLSRHGVMEYHMPIDLGQITNIDWLC